MSDEQLLTCTIAPGALAAPPEGDAGTGMVSTNAVRKRTGNISDPLRGPPLPEGEACHILTLYLLELLLLPVRGRAPFHTRP